MADLTAIAENLINGNAAAVKALVAAAVAEGVPAVELLNKALFAGMNEVGHRFKTNVFYVPDVLIAARAMHAGMEILKPLLIKSDIQHVGKVVIGTVKGDLHDIGKNLVGMMLEGAGFEVVDLGVDCAPEKFVTAVKNDVPQIVSMSALLTTTMPAMKGTIDALAEASLRKKVKVMVGGAPLTQRYADEIGADGYAPDAASAVDKAKELLGGSASLSP